MCDLVALAESLIPYIRPGMESIVDGTVAEILGNYCECFDKLYSATIVSNQETSYLQLIYSLNDVVQKLVATYPGDNTVQTNISTSIINPSVSIPEGSIISTITPSVGICVDCNKKKKDCCCKKRKEYKKVYDECGNLVATQGYIDCCDDDCEQACVFDYAVCCKPVISCPIEHGLCVRPRLKLPRVPFVPKEPCKPDENVEYPETYNLVKNIVNVLGSTTDSFEIKYDVSGFIVLIDYHQGTNYSKGLNLNRSEYKLTSNGNRLYFNINSIRGIKKSNKMLEQLNIHNGSMKYSINTKQQTYRFIIVDDGRTDIRARDFADVTRTIGTSRPKVRSEGSMLTLEENISKKVFKL